MLYGCGYVPTSASTRFSSGPGASDRPRYRRILSAIPSGLRGRSWTILLASISLFTRVPSRPVYEEEGEMDEEKKWRRGEGAIYIP